MAAEPKRLSGKRALVTGASSGIGLATARLFAAHGAAVALNGRRAQPLEALARDIGAPAVAVPGDVGVADVAESIVSRSVAALGGLDIVVNAAGIVVPCLLRDMSAQLFTDHIAVNLLGTFYVARAAALHMMERQGGTIVNVGSELSHIGMPHYVPYCASKAGVIGLTKSMAAELAPKVTVNAICPGPVDTPMMEAEIQWFGGTDKVRRDVTERVPLKRMASPEEVAVAILFLAADAPFATGATLALDGGTTAV